MDAARARYFTTELAIVTVGVFVALSVDSCREWYNDRQLVREAKAMLAQEIRDNHAELSRVLAEIPTRRTDLATTIRLADDLLNRKNSSITSVNIGFNLADLTAASWQSAEATGVLGHMPYEEVKSYSQLYSMQSLYGEHQRRTLDRGAAALAVPDLGDPYQLAGRDLEALRQQVMVMRGDLVVLEQLGAELKKGYEAMLAR